LEVGGAGNDEARAAAGRADAVGGVGALATGLKTTAPLGGFDARTVASDGAADGGFGPTGPVAVAGGGVGATETRGAGEAGGMGTGKSTTRWGVDGAVDTTLTTASTPTVAPRTPEATTPSHFARVDRAGAAEGAMNGADVPVSTDEAS
jgi:hypothetical protein